MKLGDFSESAFKTIALDIQQIGASLRVSDAMLRNMELKAGRDLDPLTQEVIFSLVSQVASFRGDQKITIPEIRVPATWWDAFRARHFDLINRLFPVRYRTIQQGRTYHAEAMLPSIPLPANRQAGRFDVLIQDFNAAKEIIQ